MAQDVSGKDDVQDKPSDGMPKMSPGVVKFIMEFLKANPDLAKEMSTRMQAVINGKQIGQQQQAPGGPQMAPQQPQQMVANVPAAGGPGRFNALERVGKGYQPPTPKPIPIEPTPKPG
jgi:hypothetical protein